MTEVSRRGRWCPKWAAERKTVDKDIECFQPYGMEFALEEAHSNNTLYVENVLNELAKLIGDMKIWELEGGDVCKVRVWRKEGWKEWKTEHWDRNWSQ
jgi:hypothetical protein